MCSLLVFSVLALAAPDRPDLTPKEARQQQPLQEQIQGEWEIVEALTNGAPNKILVANKTFFRFDGKKMMLRRDPVAKESAYDFAVDGTKSPATFEFSLNLKTGKPLAGIVKIEADTLTICYYFSTQAGKRPTEFASTPGSQAALWRMKRVKK